MMNLLELQLDGEVVLRAPIEVLHREKARQAIVLLLESNSGWGVDGGLIASIFSATAEEQDGQDHVGTFLSVSSDKRFLTAV